MLCQYLAEDLSEEEALLSAFSERISEKTAVHFNGTTFDVPFFQARCRNTACLRPGGNGADRPLPADQPLQKRAEASSCRLKALEEFLGSHRADPFTGGQADRAVSGISKQPGRTALAAMLLHNADDIRGMLSVLSMLAYPALAGRRRAGQDGACLLYRLCGKRGEKTPAPCPPYASAPPSSRPACGRRLLFRERMLRASESARFLRELKHFYPDYKNYSYLPEEDCAIHRSWLSM